MAVLKLFGYTLQWKEETEPYYDEQGDLVVNTATWSEGVKCDIAHAGGHATITNYEDGQKVGYSHVVYMKTSVPDFHYGQHVRVIKDGIIIIETDVKGFMRYQLQCKLWL